MDYKTKSAPSKRKKPKQTNKQKPQVTQKHKTSKQYKSSLKIMLSDSIIAQYKLRYKNKLQFSAFQHVIDNEEIRG